MGGGEDLPSLPDASYCPANHCNILKRNYSLIIPSSPKFRGGGEDSPSLPDASYGPGWESKNGGGRKVLDVGDCIW